MSVLFFRNEYTYVIHTMIYIYWSAMMIIILSYKTNVIQYYCLISTGGEYVLY